MEPSKFYKLIITYIMIMLIVALAIGVVYREVSKAYLSDKELEQQIMYSYFLSLCHGHTFMVGVLIPTAILVVVYVIESRNLGRINYSSLRKAFLLYMVSAIGIVSLLLYKGISITISDTSLTQAYNSLYGGNLALRESVYGIIHLLLGISIVWIVVIILRSLGKK